MSVESFQSINAAMKKDRTFMSTIPGVTATGIYGYTAPATAPTSAPSVQLAAAQLAVTDTLASLGSSSPSPLTYTAAAC